MNARIAFVSILLSFGLAAQPPLTAIQDVLYKADGTRFNGYVQIAWQSFEASDTSNIATQFRAVRIVDGNFAVKLVPTTNAEPAATYTVVYNSDGKVQFQETWAVPPSSKPLRIRDVRISTPSNLDSTAPIHESDVIGLVADLNSRPVEGPGYATGRVLMSNAIGELEAVSGNLSDCVRIDGSSGPCGGGASVNVPGYVDNEIPGGVVDGANATFSLASQPSPISSLALYRNGMLMKANFDYTISGSTFQFVSAATPQPGDTLLASYRVAATSSPVDSEPGTASVETLCSAGGSTTLSTVATALGTCVIPADTLQEGDRVAIHFDYAHAGTLSDYTFRVLWGGATIMSRDVNAADSFITGRADAAVGASSTQLSGQSWGAVLSLGAALGVASEPLDAPLTVTLSGNLTQPAGDSLTLTNFTVVRYFR
jgi:hypothetical protein